MSDGTRASPDGGARRADRRDRGGRGAHGGARAGGGTARQTAGPQTDSLTLTTASGAARLQPRWSTQDACPSGFQGSAVLYELNTDGSIGRSISPVVTDVGAPFGGTLLGSVGQLITDGTDVGDGGTDEWMVACYAGTHGTGSVDDLQSIDVSLSADGGSFWTRRPRPVATTTTLTALPDPAAAGAAVTLTATVKAADGTVPRGEVAFLARRHPDLRRPGQRRRRGHRDHDVRGVGDEPPHGVAGRVVLRPDRVLRRLGR